jgi:hypothetical protein
MDVGKALEVGSPDRLEAARRIRAGVSWIGVLAVFWAVEAPIQFATNQLTADETLAALNTPADGEEAVGPEALPLRLGAPVRDATLAINLLLSAAFGALWWRARRNIRSALNGALLVFALIGLGNAIWQPRALLSGLAVTLLTLILLVRAWKAARALVAIPSSDPLPPTAS